VLRWILDGLCLVEAGVLNLNTTYKRTCLEEKMFYILSSLKVPFTEQLSTGSGFILDFAIYIDRKENKKIAIEVDGSRWHTSQKQKKRDRFRDYILRKEGWVVIRFGEEFNINEVNNVLQQHGIR